MNTIELKDNFHKLIDKIENDSFLIKFFKIMEKASEKKEGKLWEMLTEEEKQELLIIDRDTDNMESLIPHFEMKEKHKKWL